MLDVILVLSVLVFLAVWISLLGFLRAKERPLVFRTSIYPDVRFDFHLFPERNRFHDYVRRAAAKREAVARGLPGGFLYSRGSRGEMYRKTSLSYLGKTLVPTKVYEGDSRSITMELRRFLSLPKSGERGHHFLQVREGNRGSAIQLRLVHDPAVDEFLEVQLLAASFSIRGDEEQRRPLTEKTIAFTWNCHFEKSGEHSIAFVFNVVTPNGKVQIGTSEHSVKVVKLDHLTQRQVWLLSIFAGVISGVLAIIEGLRRFGVF